MKIVQDQYLGFFSGIPKVRIFEGNKSILVREDGAKEEITIQEAKADIDIDIKEVESMTPDDLFKKFDKAAQEMATQQATAFYKEIDKAVEKVGNIIDAKGKPLSVEDFLKLLEKIQIEFDQNGQPIYPSIITGEKAAKALERVLSQLESDPVYRERHTELMERKEEEWRARESNRKLVG